MNKILAAAVILCAGSAYAADAPQIDWNQDPVAQAQGYLQAEQAGNAGLSAVTVPASEQPSYAWPSRMEAEALGSDLLSYDDSRDVTRSVELVLNNDKDRVGARVSVCEPVGAGDSGDACDYVTFSFPQLSVWGDSIEVADETVATIHHGFLGGTSITLSPAFKLSLTREVVTVDTGFDRVKKDKYSVALERTGQ